MSGSKRNKGAFQDRTLALAGLLQAARQVQEVAHHGRLDSNVLATGVHALFATDPESAEEVFGDVEAVAPGLELLVRQLIGHKRRDMELTRYLVALLHLERKLSKRPEMLGKLADGLQRARLQADHFSPTHENVIANLADLYTKTISTLKPRIMVSGQHGHLDNPANANRVRTLLLAGIRSAVLWRQCGGSRLQLVFHRHRLLAESRRLLAAVHESAATL